MIHRCLPLLAALTIAPVSAFAFGLPDLFGHIDGRDSLSEVPLAPGVLHRMESRAQGPLAIHAVIADLSRPELSLRAVTANDTLLGNELMTNMVARIEGPGARPVAGINGDFWGSGGIPIGMFVNEQGLWKHQHRTDDGRRRSVFAVDESGRPSISQPVLTIALEGPEGETLLIDGFNQPQANRTTIGYSRLFGPTAPPLEDDREQIVLILSNPVLRPNTTVTAEVLSTDMRQDVTLDPEIFAIHTREEIPEWLHAGAEVRLAIRYDTVEAPVIAAIGGGPMILRDGEVVAVEQGRLEAVGERFVTNREPRTAIGIKEDGKTVVMVVVDGRQPGRSMGVSLPDLAEIMAELGAVHAMNLDGGGSSTLTIGGELANFPSDAAGQRAVTNALFVMSSAETGAATVIDLVPRNVRIPVGGTSSLAATFRGGQGEPLPRDRAIEFESSDESIARVDDAGRVTAIAPGTVTITAFTLFPPIIEGTTTLVVDEPASIEVEPAAVLLDLGERVSLRLRVLDGEGIPFYAGVTPSQIEAPRFIRMNRATMTATGNAPGRGLLTVRMGEVSQVVPIAVEDFAELVLERFDAPKEVALQLINANEEGSRLMVSDAEQPRGGKASMLRYAMAPEGTSRIAIPMGVEILGGEALGLWVHGNGSGHLLRGELEDADGSVFLLDFSDAREGINWADSWRQLRADLLAPALLRGENGRPRAPMTLRTIYLVQPNIAKKSDGELLLGELAVLSAGAD